MRPIAEMPKKVTGLKKKFARTRPPLCLAWALPRALVGDGDVRSAVLASKRKLGGTRPAESCESDESSTLRRELSGHLAYWQLPEPTSAASEKRKTQLAQKQS